jgi:hypothetical protein
MEQSSLLGRFVSCEENGVFGNTVPEKGIKETNKTTYGYDHIIIILKVISIIKFVFELRKPDSAVKSMDKLA